MEVPEIQLTIAVGLVAIYSWSRYNTPTTSRSETTWSKFLLGRLAYVAIVLGGFAVLSTSPWLAQPLIKELSAAGVTVPNPEDVAFPLIVALALTVFLSEVPILSRLDRALRGYFHRVASIPRERRLRIAMLRRSPLAVSEEVRAEAVKRIEAQGLREEDLVLDPEDGSPESLWTRLTVHTVCLEHLARSPKYAAKLIESDPYEEFRRSYERLADKAKHAFPLLRSGPDEKAVRLLRQEFVEHTQGLLSLLYDFLSRLMLNCERTERQRQTCMESLGLNPDRKPQPPPVHEFLWLLLLLMTTLSVSIGSLGGDLAVTKILSIALAQVAAVAIALVVHPVGPAATRLPVPPVGRYLLAGGLAFSAWAVLRGLATLLESGGVGTLLTTGRSDALVQMFERSGPWSLLTVAVAVILCGLTDDWVDQRIGRVRDRFDLGGWLNPVDGLVVALGMAATTYFLVYPHLAKAPAAGRGLLALATGGIGLLLGLLVPSAYRRRSSEATEEEPSASGPSHAPRLARSGG